MADPSPLAATRSNRCAANRAGPRYGQGVPAENVQILEVTELATPVTLTGRVDLGEAVLVRGPQPGTRAFWVSWTGDRDPPRVDLCGQVIGSAQLSVLRDQHGRQVGTYERLASGADRQEMIMYLPGGDIA